MSDGEYVASIVVHELAHIVTAAAYWPRSRPVLRHKAIQSHGPEFARSYLDLLSVVMPIRRTEEAFAYLAVQVTPALPEGPLADRVARLTEGVRQGTFPFRASEYTPAHPTKARC